MTLWEWAKSSVIVCGVGVMMAAVIMLAILLTGCDEVEIVVTNYGSTYYDNYYDRDYYDCDDSWWHSCW